MAKLSINGVYLDLLDEDIDITFQVNTLTDATSKNATYSTDIMIPNTSHNVGVLGFTSLSVRNGVKLSKQKVINVILEIGDVQLLGYLQLTTFSEGIYTCSFFCAVSSLTNDLSDKKLRDLNLDRYKHVYNSENICAIRTEGWVYPFVNYGHWEVTPNLYIGGHLHNDKHIYPAQTFYPAMFTHTVVKQIFADAGWVIDPKSELLSDEAFNCEILPFSTGQFKYDERNFALANQHLSHFQTVTTAQFGLPIVVLWDNVVNTSPQNIESYQYIAPQDGYYSIKTDALITASSDPVDPVSFNYRFIVNGVAQSWSAVKIINTSHFYLQGYIFAPKGGMISLELRTYDSSFNPSSLSITSYIELSAETEISYSHEIYPALFLPNMSQKDFLKDLFVQYGILSDFSLTRKSVRLDFIRNIKFKKPINITDKIDYSKPITINYNKLNESYGKANFIRMEQPSDEELFKKDTESVFEPKINNLSNQEYTPHLDYNKVNKVIQYGDGYFGVDNDFLEGEKEFYKSPFAGTINYKWFNKVENVVPIPFIPYCKKRIEYNGSEQVTKIEPEYNDLSSPRKLYTKEMLATDILIDEDLTSSGNIIVINDEWRVDFSQAFATDSINYAWFEKPVFNKEIDESRYNLIYGKGISTSLSVWRESYQQKVKILTIEGTYNNSIIYDILAPRGGFSRPDYKGRVIDSSSVINPNDKGLIELNMTELINIVNASVMIECHVLLNPEILEYKVVTIDNSEFAGKYLIDSIVNFRGYKDSSVVNLIKI